MDTIQKIFSQEKLDAMLFFSSENRFWLTNFCSSLGYLLVIAEQKCLFVDGCYITNAQHVVDKKISVNLLMNIWT